MNHPPYQAAPQKKNNLLLYLLIGGIACVLLVVIGAVVIVVMGGFMTYQATSSSSPPTVGPTVAPMDACAKAADCCRKLAGKNGGSTAPCEAWRNPQQPASSCQSAISGYQLGLKAHGLTCD